MNHDLSQVKVGDLIAFQDRWAGIRLVKVTRITPTQVIADLDKFNKATGRLIGSSGYNMAFGRPVTDADLLVVRVRKATKSLAAVKVTAENVESVEALLKSLEAK